MDAKTAAKSILNMAMQKVAAESVTTPAPGEAGEGVKTGMPLTGKVLELVNQIELLKREIQSLRGQLEVVGNSIENTAKRQRDMYLDLDTRLRRFEQQGAPAAEARKAARVVDERCARVLDVGESDADDAASAESFFASPIGMPILAAKLGLCAGPLLETRR